ncbi:hypothetical protein D3C74_240460 [compost metagenome]
MQRGIFLHQLAVGIIGFCADGFSFPLANLPGRAGTDTLFDKAGSAPDKVFPGKLGFVGGFRTHILTFHLMNFAMHIPPSLKFCGTAHGFNGAGLLGRLLRRQLFTGGIQLFAALFHAELGFLHALTVFCHFFIAGASMGSAPVPGGFITGRWFPLTPQAFRGPGCFAVLAELSRLRANLARSDRVSRFWRGSCVRGGFIFKSQFSFSRIRRGRARAIAHRRRSPRRVVDRRRCFPGIFFFRGSLLF